MESSSSIRSLDCPICVKSINLTPARFFYRGVNLNRLTVTKCNHFFHTLCLLEWIQYNDACPECRTDHPFERGAVINPEINTSNAELMVAIEKAGKTVVANLLRMSVVYKKTKDKKEIKAIQKEVTKLVEKDYVWELDLLSVKLMHEETEADEIPFVKKSDKWKGKMHSFWLDALSYTFSRVDQEQYEVVIEKIKSAPEPDQWKALFDLFRGSILVGDFERAFAVLEMIPHETSVTWDDDEVCKDVRKSAVIRGIKYLLIRGDVVWARIFVNEIPDTYAKKNKIIKRIDRENQKVTKLEELSAEIFSQQMDRAWIAKPIVKPEECRSILAQLAHCGSYIKALCFAYTLDQPARSCALSLLSNLYFGKIDDVLEKSEAEQLIEKKLEKQLDFATLGIDLAKEESESEQSESESD